MAYAIYLRKSREDVEAERHGKFETLAKHEQKLTELAASRGYEVSDIYRELASGDSLSQRPECQRMLRAVSAGAYDGVLVVNLMRLTRGDMVDQGTIISAFMYSGTLIITPEKTYDVSDSLDRDYTEMRMLFSRMEYGSIKANMLAGKVGAVKQGQYIGSFPPYGWDKVVVDRKKTLAPNADNPRMVSWYERIASGDTPREIADEMNLLGIPSPRGKMWDRSMVINVIRNPVNKGYVRWNQKKTVTVLDGDMQKVKRRQKAQPILARGLHEGTVDEGLWQRANDAIAARNANPVPRAYALKDPLAGLLVCRHCGRAMGRMRNSRYETEYYAHSVVNKRECRVRGAKVGDVVCLLAESLAEVAEDVDFREGGAPKASATPQLERDLEAEGKSAETLFRLVEKGMITDEEFAERRELSRRRVAALEERLAESRESDRNAARVKERRANLKRAIAELFDCKGRAAEVNVFLKSVLDRVEYERDPQTGVIHLGVFLK